MKTITTICVCIIYSTLCFSQEEKMTLKRKNEIYSYFKNSINSKKELQTSQLDSLCSKVIEFAFKDFAEDTSFSNNIKKLVFVNETDFVDNYQEEFCLEIIFTNGGSYIQTRTDKFPEKRYTKKQKQENEWHFLEFLKEIDSKGNIPYNLIDKFHFEILMSTNENKILIEYDIKCSNKEELTIIKRDKSIDKNKME